MITTTVFLVPHDLTLVDLLVLIDIPEDDATVGGLAEVIEGGGMLHLSFGEDAGREQAATEDSVGRKGGFD